MRHGRLAALLVVTLIGRAGNGAPPDVRGGNIDGKVALLQWPATMPADSNHDPVPLPSADGCFVYLVPHTDVNQELRYPCGKWFAPPPDRYNAWLETDGAITPNPVFLTYSGSPFQGHGRAAITPVAPAGRVAIPGDRTLADRESLRFLSIENGDWWNRNASSSIGESPLRTRRRPYRCRQAASSRDASTAARMTRSLCRDPSC